MESEENNDEKQKFIDEIPGLIEDLYPGCGLGQIKELLSRIAYVDDFEQEYYIQQMDYRLGGKKVGFLRSGLKSVKKNISNLPFGSVEDSYWLKIYNEVNDEYGSKVVSMSDSRQLMLKRGNIYTPDITNFTKFLSDKCDKYNTSYRNVRNDVLEKFRDSHIFDRNNFCYDPFIINFKNGYYDIIKDKFVESKNNRGKNKRIFFYEIPHEYKEGDYACPKFLDALQKWLGVGNTVSPKDMFQFMGYTMSMNIGLKKAFMLYGESGSGKTQFKEILEYIIGNENTIDISLQKLGDDQFSSSSLEWKILNYHDDLPPNMLNDVSTFKVIVGGGSTFPVRRMHTEPYQAICTVKLWFNANDIPLTKATEDDSFFNRWNLINFPNVFKKDSKDPTYEDIPYFYKSITEDEDEVQGIIHYCLKALTILYKNKGFRKELYSNSRKLWEYESDLLYAFLDKYTEDDEDEYIIDSEFREYYNTYRKSRKPSRKKPGVTAQTLNKDMEIRGYERKRKSSENGKYAYEGLKWNNNFKTDKQDNFQKKSYKTREDYIEDHPNYIQNGNGESEPEYEDMGSFHGGIFDDKEKFEAKLKKEKLIKN